MNIFMELSNHERRSFSVSFVFDDQGFPGFRFLGEEWGRWMRDGVR